MFAPSSTEVSSIPRLSISVWGRTSISASSFCARTVRGMAEKPVFCNVHSMAGQCRTAPRAFNAWDLCPAAVCSGQLPPLGRHKRLGDQCVLGHTWTRTQAWSSSSSCWAHRAPSNSSQNHAGREAATNREPHQTQLMIDFRIRMPKCEFRPSRYGSSLFGASFMEICS